MQSEIARTLLLAVLSVASATGQLLNLAENVAVLPASALPVTEINLSFGPSSSLLAALPPASSALIGFKPTNNSAAQWMSLSDFASILAKHILPEQTASELINTARNAVNHLDAFAASNATAARNYFADQYGYLPQGTGEKVEAWIENHLKQSADNLHGKGMLDVVARELDNANDAVRQLASLRFTMDHVNIVSDFIRRYKLEQLVKNQTDPSTSLKDMYSSFKSYVRVKRQAEAAAAADTPAAKLTGDIAAETSAIGNALQAADGAISGAIGSVLGGVGGVLGSVGGGIASGISAIPGGEAVLGVVSTFTGGLWQTLEIGVLIIDQFVLSFTKIDGMFKPLKQLASMAFPPIGLVFDGVATAECFWNKKYKLLQLKSVGDAFSFLACGMNYIKMFQKGIGMIG